MTLPIRFGYKTLLFVVIISSLVVYSSVQIFYPKPISVTQLNVIRSSDNFSNESRKQLLGTRLTFGGKIRILRDQPLLSMDIPGIGHKQAHLLLLSKDQIKKLKVGQKVSGVGILEDISYGALFIRVQQLKLEQ